MTYGAIAISTKYPDVLVEKIEAKTDEEANQKAEKWYKDDIGFAYTYLVTKEISKCAKVSSSNACLECDSDLSSGFHDDGCSNNGFYKPWSKIKIKNLL